MELDGLLLTVMSPLTVTLTPKSNQHIYEPKYICDQNWVKFPSLVFEKWCSQSFRGAQIHSWQTHPQTECAFGTEGFQRWRHKKYTLQTKQETLILAGQAFVLCETIPQHNTQTRK